MSGTFHLSQLIGGFQCREVDALEDFLVQLCGLIAVKCHTKQDESISQTLQKPTN